MRRASLAIVLAALGTGPALAGNPTVAIVIDNGNGNAWTEQLVTTSQDASNGLLVLDTTTGGFTMRQGSAGQSISMDGVDAWTWQGSYWSWHSAQTAADGSFLAEMELHGISSNGDPDLSYDLTVKNTTGLAQNYRVFADAQINPALTGPNQVYASVAGNLSATQGTLRLDQSQSFNLSANGGNTLVNAGVDISLMPAYVTAGQGSFGAQSALQAGPAGAWNYMTLSSAFTLSGGTGSASIQGYASITPVPEPATYGLLLAGLGVVSLVARRRRR